MTSNNWYVITGSPSSGKTTLLNEFEKLGHKTVPEAARAIIDEALKNGITIKELRSNEKHFQDEIVRMKEKNEAAQDKNVLTFFDRGMQDTIAYARHYGFDLEEWVLQLMNKAKYQKVFLLEPLSIFQSDYARTEDHGFAQNLHLLLDKAYQDYGMQPIHIPPLSLDDRVKFILDKLKLERTV